jgi:hypothetical protein
MDCLMPRAFIWTGILSVLIVINKVVRSLIVVCTICLFIWTDSSSKQKHQTERDRRTDGQTDRQTDNIELDIALAHPWNSDIFPTSAFKNKWSNSIKERRMKESQI